MRGAALAGLLAIAAWSSCLLMTPPRACGEDVGRPGEAREVSGEAKKKAKKKKRSFVDFHEITANLTRRWGLATERSDSTVMPGIQTIRRREGETATSYVERIRKEQQALEARVRALPPEGVPVTVEYDWPLLSRASDMTYPEIATHCGISVKMVEKHISRAIAACLEKVGSSV